MLLPVTYNPVVHAKKSAIPSLGIGKRLRR
jgi:hypothetical protein